MSTCATSRAGPGEILAGVNALEGATVTRPFTAHPVIVDRENLYVQALGEAISM